MEDEELEVFTKLADDKGEISKHDLIVHTKNSSFWKSNLDLKTKGGSHSTKVKQFYWEDKNNLDTPQAIFWVIFLFQNKYLSQPFV